MSETKKGIKEGPPIWVESLMTKEQWRECSKKYSTYNSSEPFQFNPEYHKGGKWREIK